MGTSPNRGHVGKGLKAITTKEDGRETLVIYDPEEGSAWVQSTVYFDLAADSAR